MTHRLITAVFKADLNLKHALFPGNCNIFPQVRPTRFEPRQFVSQLSSRPPKGFCKSFSQLNGNKCGTCTAGGIGADRKSSSLSGGTDGADRGEEKNKGGPGSESNNKTWVFIGTGSILGVCWVYLNQDFNWKGAMDNFLSKSTVECECALAIPDVKSKPDETLQKGPNAIDQETTDGGNQKESDPVDLAQLVNAAKSTDPQIQCSAVNSLLKLLTSGRKPPIDFLIGCNIIPTLVDCLSSPNPGLQLDALTILSEIVSPTSQHQIQAVVEAGAVPHFLRFLTSPHENARENALKALSCIIFFGPQLRDCVINLGIVAPLLLNCIQQRDTSTAFMRQVTGVIVNLCICIDPPPSQETVLEILPALNDLVQHSDPLVLLLAAWALKNLAEGGQDQIQMVIDSGVLPKLVQLLNYRGDAIPEIAAVAVGTIIGTATHDQTQAVLKCFALSHLHNLLEHPNETICEFALMVLAKCVDENLATVQAVIEAALIPPIIHHLEKRDLQTRNTAAFALRSLTVNGNQEQVTHLIDFGVIPPLCDLLNSKDSKVVQIVLDGIRNILTKFSVNQGDGDKVSSLIKECGGWDKIQTLQNHENVEIRKKAHDIILKFSSDN